MKDLFGNDIENNKDSARNELEYFDKNTFSHRLKRLKHINKIYPFGTHIFGSEESSIIFKETLNNYIFGNFTSVIILSLSFIERRIQEYYNLRFDKRYKSNLNTLLREMEKEDFIDKYFIDRINKLRKYRNPLVHFRDPNHEDSLEFRSIESKKLRYELLERDAKESLDLMLIISKFRVL